MNNIRNLWAESRVMDADAKRRTIDNASRVIYSLFIVLIGLVSLALYTRSSSEILRWFGVGSALLLVVSDIFLAWATHHSAAGGQRNAARTFWVANIVIATLNIWVLYNKEMGFTLEGIEVLWYRYGSLSNVVVALVGWSLYSSLSHEQKLNDVTARMHTRAIRALEHGVEHPDETTQEAFNGNIAGAASMLADHASRAVLGHANSLSSAAHKQIEPPTVSQSNHNTVSNNSSEQETDKPQSFLARGQGWLIGQGDKKSNGSG